MPDTRRITMRKIKDVLRLKLESKLSHERIAASLKISKGVIGPCTRETYFLAWRCCQSRFSTELGLPVRCCH